MVIPSAAVVLLFSSALQGPASPGTIAKGTCPPPAKVSLTIPKRATPPSPIAGVHYIGAVTMVVSLSDTGYVCDVQVIKGLEEKLDKQAIDVIRKAFFQPIQEEGKPIAGSMIVQRDFWRGNTSDTIYSETAGAISDEISAEARSFPAADIDFVRASAKVQGNSYRNQYFDVSFVAPGAMVNVPSEGDGERNGARLVEVDASGGERTARYTIALLADRLSTHPDLKSVSEYVDGAGAQLKREGAQTSRDNFAYIISGVEFTGSIFKISDGPDLEHFQGVFSTVMKGYVLSISTTATSEQLVLKLASSVQFKRGK